MRPLSQYSAGEWTSGKPFIHRIKRVRNLAVDRAFRRARPRGLDRFLADHFNLSGRTVAVAVAYNTPWVIDLLTRTARRNLQDAALVIVDNSPRADRRAEIERICRERAVPYLGLPYNPEWRQDRSHGIALNWIYYNLLHALLPRVFAFLDHDLFPLAPTDLAQLVATQPFYGRRSLLRSPHGWSLWAGYCIYDFAAVEAYPLDFNNDQSITLSTGGCNWPVLYRHFDQGKLRFASEGIVNLRDPLDGMARPCEMVDGLVHVGAASYDYPVPTRQEPAFYERIVRRCEDGATLSDLRA